MLILYTFAGKVCEEVECGKGTCVVNTSYPLGFICECDSGWKRTPNDDDNYTIANSFLPCVLPQCMLLIVAQADYSLIN